MDFDSNYYISKNTEVTTEKDAKTHYCNFGIAEEKEINSQGDKTVKEFDCSFYTTFYQEFNEFSERQALHHYLTEGLYEGRYASENERLKYLMLNKKEDKIVKNRLIYPRYKPVYIIISAISYPFGGGESYLLQTMKHAKEEGYVCIWFSFQKKNNVLYEEDIIEYVEDGIFYKVKGGINDEKIREIVNFYRPDIVHTQGRNSSKISNIVSEFRIPVICGYHFWMGLVKLNEDGSNRDILDNIHKHQIDLNYLKLKDKGVMQYVASEFMNNVLTGLKYPPIENVIYPLTDKTFYKIDEYNVNAKYITVVNICKLKGGEIVLNLIKKTKLPFLVIQTEPMSQGLDKEILKEIEKNKNSVYLETQDNMKNIYLKSRMVLIPSLVDETFCRVGYECISNGIPLLTTGKGYIKSMIEGADELILSENLDDWIEPVTKMYNDKDKLLGVSSKLLKICEKYNENDCKQKLINMCKSVSCVSKNIMIIAPWCDQGLGIQSKTYSRILRNKGYKVYIFAFLPYYSLKYPYGNNQQNPEEWKEADDIYYSYNTRENITESELTHFINKYRIGTCLFPEICWNHVFKIAETVNDMNVRVYAIPNVEIVIKREIPKYSVFYKILSPSQILIDKFKDKKICEKNYQMSYIGHGVKDNTCKDYKTKYVKDRINFLHVSGLNALERKQTLSVVDAFNLACESCNNIYLTVTVQGNITKIPEIYEKCKNDRITLIDKHLSHEEIINLYKENHVSIQVSSHEGLGLGFYESISCSVPVISLKTSPHDEVIKDDISGWLVDCEFHDLKDNNDAIVKGAYFKIEDLAEKITYVSNNVKEVNKLIVSCSLFFLEHFTEDKLVERMISAF